MSHRGPLDNRPEHMFRNTHASDQLRKWPSRSWSNLCEGVAAWLTQSRDAIAKQKVHPRLSVLALEDRVVPATLTIQAIDPTASEAGGTGLFQVIRTGDVSGSLHATYTVAGTATANSDYTALSGTVNFAANQAIVTITVSPLFDRSIHHTI